MQSNAPITQWLQSQGIAVREDWVNQCIRYCQEQHRLDPRNQDGLREKVFQYLLYADFDEIGTGVFPPNVAEMHKQTIEGPIVVQVNELINISENYERNTEDTARRMLKLFLTDGRQQGFAIEYGRIPGLSTTSPAGLKIAIKSATVRRGVILLTGANTHVLGGEVEKYSDLQSGSRGSKPVGASAPTTTQTSTRAGAQDLDDSPSIPARAAITSIPTQVAQSQPARPHTQSTYAPPPVGRTASAAPAGPAMQTKSSAKVQVPQEIDEFEQQIIDISDEFLRDPEFAHPDPSITEPKSRASGPSKPTTAQTAPAPSMKEHKTAAKAVSHLLDFTRDVSELEFDYSVWTQAEEQPKAKYTDASNIESQTTTRRSAAPVEISLIDDDQDEPRNQRSSESTTTKNVVAQTQKATHFHDNLGESPMSIEASARQLSFSASPLQAPVIELQTPPPVTIHKRPPRPVVTANRQPFSHISVLLQSSGGAIGRVKAKAVGTRLFKPAKDRWDVIIDFEDHSGCVPVRLDDKFCQALFESSAQDFRKLLRTTDKAGQSAMIEEKLRKLQAMDGIFTLQKTAQPEALDEEVQVQLILNGKVNMSAATASRLLLSSLKLSLDENSPW